MVRFILSVLVLLASSAAIRAEKPLAVISGADSKFTKAQYVLVTSNGEWQKIWAAHLGTTPDDAYKKEFEVDFEKCMVVVILRGSSTNVRGLKIKNVAIKDAIAVQFQRVGYQTVGGADTTTPFAFVILPKMAKDVVLEEDVQNLKNEPPEWKEIARLKYR